jgi:hypothetical protein
MSALIITLPSALDLLIDMIPNAVVSYVFSEDARPRGKQSNTLLFHLTIFEKWMYIVGVICLSTITFDPVLNYSGTTGVFSATTTLYVCFQNASTILLLNPVLSFLTRCCPTWTPLRSLFLAVLICTASLLSSSIGFLDPTSQTALNMAFACNVILCICSGLYFCMIILCLVNTFYYRVRYHDDERLVSSDSNSKATSRAISEERFRNLVIAAHMTTNFFDLVLNNVWYFYSLTLTYQSLSTCMYLVVAFAVIIFVTESRVRKHAVVVTMVRAIV